MEVRKPFHSFPEWLWKKCFQFSLYLDFGVAFIYDTVIKEKSFLGNFLLQKQCFWIEPRLTWRFGLTWLEGGYTPSEWSRTNPVFIMNSPSRNNTIFLRNSAILRLYYSFVKYREKNFVTLWDFPVLCNFLSIANICPLMFPSEQKITRFCEGDVDKTKTRKISASNLSCPGW